MGQWDDTQRSGLPHYMKQVFTTFIKTGKGKVDGPTPTDSFPRLKLIPYTIYARRKLAFASRETIILATGNVEYICAHELCTL